MIFKSRRPINSSCKVHIELGMGNTNLSLAMHNPLFNEETIEKAHIILNKCHCLGMNY